MVEGGGVVVKGEWDSDEWRGSVVGDEGGSVAIDGSGGYYR